MSTKGLDILLLNVYERAKNNNIQIVNFIPKMGEDLNQQERFNSAPSHTYFEVNLAAQAQNYDDMMNFISSLEGHENMPIVSRIKSLDITDVYASNQLSEEKNSVQNQNVQSESSGQTTQSSKFTLNITLVIYTLTN